MINNKKPVYNLKVDSKKNKFDGGEELKISSTDELPNYIKNNLDKYKNLLEEKINGCIDSAEKKLNA